MAQRKPEDFSFDQVVKLVDALVPEERAKLYRHLQFRFWDEEFAHVQCRLNEERAAAGLPNASDDEVHDAIDSMRSAEDWNEFHREIQKGIDVRSWRRHSSRSCTCRTSRKKQDFSQSWKLSLKQLLSLEQVWQD